MKRQTAKNIITVLIFLLLSLVLYLAGNYPRHILENIHKYLIPQNNAVVPTIINIICWIVFTFFVLFLLQCNSSADITKRLLQYKKLLILFVSQLFLDLLAWGFELLLKDYLYAYRTFSIAVMWILIYFLFTPGLKYQNVFIIGLVILTVVFIALDVKDALDYQKINSMISGCEDNQSLYNTITDNAYLLKILSRVYALRSFVLESIIGSLLLIVQHLSRNNKLVK